MKVPIFERLQLKTWNDQAFDSWDDLTREVKVFARGVSHNDAFDRRKRQLLGLAERGIHRPTVMKELARLLQERITVRALVSLWLEDVSLHQTLMSREAFQAMRQGQHGRFGRLGFVQLINLYFRYFDRLDLEDTNRNVLGELQRTLREGLTHFEENSRRSTGVINALKTHAELLLQPDAAQAVTRYAKESDIEFYELFKRLGIQSYMQGRFADVCHFHYYLEALKECPLDEKSEVFTELLQEDVYTTPYEGKLTLGHAALMILIDRAIEADDISDVWLEFIIDLAGDPRISKHSKHFLFWWSPLGEERIDALRSWFAKEDLRLFLEAVQEYGKETDNAPLKRMFAARKLFLEGLFKLKLVRDGRLMLGSLAASSVKRILLQNDIKPNYIKLLSDLGEHAIIYLDCGKFYIVEGSHNFKIWIYLKKPSNEFTRYERQINFNRNDLISRIPRAYQKLHPESKHASYSHNGDTWAVKVLDFLQENGIHLDREVLLQGRLEQTKSPHTHYRPHTQSAHQKEPNDWTEPLKTPEDLKSYINMFHEEEETIDENLERAVGSTGDEHDQNLNQDLHRGRGVSLSELGIDILTLLKVSPGQSSLEIKQNLGLDSPRTVNRIMRGELEPYCYLDRRLMKWKLSASGVHIAEQLLSGE